MFKSEDWERPRTPSTTADVSERNKSTSYNCCRFKRARHCGNPAGAQPRRRHAGGGQGGRRRRARVRRHRGGAGWRSGGRTGARGARQERQVREARRVQEQRARDARVQAQAHYDSAGRRGEEAHGAWNSARDVEFGSARTFRRATFEEALGAAQRWTPEQLCFRSSKAGGIVTSLRMH